MTLRLQRLTFTRDGPTFGVLLQDNLPLCVTIEKPWRDNAAKISCIPPGAYRMTKFKSPSKGQVFLLHNVPDRSMIELHVANRESELLGCIACGRSFNGDAITDSRATLAMLLGKLPDETTLEIRNPP